ncbi:MAG: hypothetical protein P8R54_06960 [Myxococcota bacterium]|nr:hypothetical protein [Myxococcota bacterium]
MSFVMLRCRNCGSGVPAQPDNLLTICDHCGTLYPSTELAGIPVHIVPSIDEAAIRKAVIERMAVDKQMKNVRIDIESSSGVYVPMFVSRASVSGWWKGYRNERRNKQTVKIWKDGTIDSTGDFPVLARKHAHEFGLAGLGRVVLDAEPVPIGSVVWEDSALPVLSVDMTGEQVDDAVEDNLIDLIGERVKAGDGLTAITEFDTEVSIASRLLLLYPLWTVTYRYRGGSYRVAVGGGRGVVLSAMEPMFYLQRIMRLFVGIGAVGASGGLFYLGCLLLPMMTDDDGAGVIIGIGAAVLACSWAAIATAGRLVASVNVENIGESQGWL